VRVTGGQAIAVIDLDHCSVAARRTGADDATGPHRANFGAIGLQEIAARMEREPAKERVDAVAEGRGDCCFASKGFRTGMKGMSALRRPARPTSRATRAAAKSNAGDLGSTSIGIRGPPSAAPCCGAASFIGSRPVSATIAASRAEGSEADRSMLASAIIWPLSNRRRRFVRRRQGERLDRLQRARIRLRLGAERDAARGLGRERSHDRAPLFEARLPQQKFAHLGFERALVEQLPARGLVEAPARLGQSALIVRLHLRLPRDNRRDDFVAQGKIGRALGPEAERQRRQRDQRPQDRRPDHQRADPVAAGDRQKVVGGPQARP
jgi:hypothetical protein